jgi:hypothetical protein
MSKSATKLTDQNTIKAQPSKWSRLQHFASSTEREFYAEALATIVAHKPKDPNERKIWIDFEYGCIKCRTTEACPAFKFATLYVASLDEITELKAAHEG